MKPSIALACVCIWILGCAQQGTPYDPAKDSDEVSSPGAPPSYPGGHLTPPRSIPANSYTTTSGGYITFKNIVESKVERTLNLVGATQVDDRLVILFERSPSHNIYFWEIYTLAPNSKFEVICSIPRPIASAGSFLNVTSDGDLIYVLNSDYRTGINVYQLDLSDCSTSPRESLFSIASSSQRLAFAIHKSKYYVAINGPIQSFDLNTQLIQSFTYDKESLANVKPNPNYPSFTINQDGALWYTDGSARLWQGGIDGKWTGWGQLPYTTYRDLMNTHSIVSFRDRRLKIVTFDPSAMEKMLRVYTIDASHF